jgi:type II secretory pathway pseudopilin PulG
MSRSHPARSSAFTLGELMVVITILTLVVLSLIPALSRTRRAAMDDLSFANMRVLYQVHAAYWGDNQDAFINPYNSFPSSSYDWGSIRVPGTSNFSYPFNNSPQGGWMFAPFWASLISRNLANHPYNGLPQMFAPSDTIALNRAIDLSNAFPSPINALIVDGSYWVSPTTWINPSLLSTTTALPINLRTSNLSHWRRNRISDAVFPSTKVLFWERFDYNRADRVGPNGVREPFSPSWINPEAASKAVTIDGSVGAIQMLQLHNRVAATGLPTSSTLPFTPVGRFRNYIFSSTLQDFEIFPDPIETSSDWPAFFFATRDGIHGRDLIRPVIRHSGFTPVGP